MTGPVEERIVLAHGGGGQLTDDLLEAEVFPRLAGPDGANPWLADADDAAVLDVPAGRLAFTTDSYVVRPLEFPGGDIGRLAVCGTVNDLAVCGARPAWLALGLVLEEGLPLATLRRVLDSAAAVAAEAGVRVVAGDTKVVERGQADGMYAVTSGLGVVPEGRDPGFGRIGPDDVLLLSGNLAEHGLAVMLARQPETSFRSDQRSDVAPIGGLVEALYDAVPGVRFLRDPTRGGFAGVVADLARRTGFGLVIDEARIPLRVETRRIADMLGLDPLAVANEGKLLAVVAAEDAEAALAALRAHPLGTRASLVGRFTESRDGLCEMITEAGGRRVLQKPYGEELPRIC